MNLIPATFPRQASISNVHDDVMDSPVLPRLPLLCVATIQLSGNYESYQ